MPETKNNQKCCGKSMSNFSYHRNNLLEEKVDHFCCAVCGARIHDGKNYTADEWFFYINGITYQEYQEQLLMEQSVHTHELVNHRNPEDCDENGSW